MKICKQYMKKTGKKSCVIFIQANVECAKGPFRTMAARPLDWFTIKSALNAAFAKNASMENFSNVMENPTALKITK